MYMVNYISYKEICFAVHENTLSFAHKNFHRWLWVALQQSSTRFCLKMVRNQLYVLQLCTHTPHRLVAAV